MSRFTPGASSGNSCGKKNLAEIRTSSPCLIAEQRGIRCGLRRAAAPGVDRVPRPGCGCIDAARCVGVDERLLCLHRTATAQSKHSNRSHSSGSARRTRSDPGWDAAWLPGGTRMNQETHQKVKATHLKRNAYLYIRQSTPRQVIENTESTKYHGTVIAARSMQQDFGICCGRGSYQISHCERFDNSLHSRQL